MTAIRWARPGTGSTALGETSPSPALPCPRGAFYEDLCYHAQQAAEKAIKAVYQHRRWEFRYIHDLDELLTGLKKQGLKIPSEVAETVALNSYGSGVRYPSFDEPVAEEEYRQAVKMAEIVLRWAETQINGE